MVKTKHSVFKLIFDYTNCVPWEGLFKAVQGSTHLYCQHWAEPEEGFELKATPPDEVSNNKCIQMLCQLDQAD